MFTIKEGTPPEKIGEGTSPETLKAISEYLERNGSIIRTADQEKSFREMMSNQDVNKALSDSHAKTEATIFETTGIEKKPGEKFYDYHKRALGEKLTNVKILEDKVKKYESEGFQSSDLLKQARIDLEKAQATIAEQNNEWKKKFETKESEIFNSRVDSEIERVLGELRASIDPTIKPELVPDILAARLAKFRNENQPYNSDGFVVWKDPKTGATRTSKQDGKAQNFKDLFTPYLADVAGTPRQQSGAGSGSNQQDHSGGGRKYNEITLPDSVKTQVELTAFLVKEMKMDPSGKDFVKAFEALKGDMKLR